ncbi:hypothetical protein L0663_04960 [Dyadobacter sp. CY107]|uniref:hypothetical protein n=1 Tax=Dyadobacter fanqingshengii TaxID=2906443 RepID=UPI001F3DD652|nr:hypothetical protein [Dyadobacter fanqingshengii]MCF2502716.1 hypothetical protein [Dyadobacter fanqingshengii]
MPVTATIRMYNQDNLGDCFLLHFANDGQEAYLLIDFGSYEGDNTLREKLIAENIKETIGDKKLTIVLTHQHKDHLSGFLHAGDLLKGKERELWLSYLDSEKSKEGQAIRSLMEKYWKKNEKINELIKVQPDADGRVANMRAQKLGFDLFGETQSSGAAITKLLEISNDNVNFLTPGESFFMPGTNDGVKVYVLGPPFDQKLLKKMNPSKADEVVGLDMMMDFANIDISSTLMLDALLSATGVESAGESDFPFAKRYIDYELSKQINSIPVRQDNNDAECPDDKSDPNKRKDSISEIYAREDWRKIDEEWLSEIGRLSLHMDTLTNNTSLVLAFELVKSKRVLLFVGDAQIGNWKSWMNIKIKGSDVTGEDLLSRTVLYKAGHHSSHNATLRQGLDLMNDKELMILIPVNEKVSTHRKFSMLKPDMLRGYHRKSKGRVLRSDTIFQDGSQFMLNTPFVDATTIGNKLKVFPISENDHLYLELQVTD